MNRKDYDVIIIGGSYSGLSAAMTLGRSLRQVLVIDSGQPCNKQTPHSHNFITQDGETPAAIRQKALEQVQAYSTINFVQDLAIRANKLPEGFAIETAQGEVFIGKKLLFATGVKDLMPAIPGFAASWGISVLHCPYCHGYEVSSRNLGVLANGDIGFEFTKLISNWSKNLMLFTNGKSTLTPEQESKLASKNIKLIENEILELEQENGQIRNLVFRDGSQITLDALFARVPYEQHCKLPEIIGCALSEQGFIQIDDFQRTNIAGVYAAGDCTTQFRTVSFAVAGGTKAGAMINKELIDEQF